MVTDDVGILTPADDIRALADAIIQLANDTELREKMGKTARQRYEKLFTPEPVMQLLIDLYEGVIHGHSSGVANNSYRAKPRIHPWID